MNEPFELPVLYKGEEMFFPAQLLPYGYSHRFQVNLYGQDVFFEPDEERNYRAIVEADKANNKITVELLKAVVNAIERIVK